MQDINLSLSLEEVNFLLQVIGELPTKTGAYALLMKMKAQAEGQLETSAKEPQSETN